MNSNDVSIFPNHNVVGVDQEPICITSANNLIIIGTSNGEIQLFTDTSPSVLVHRFHAAGHRIKTLQYLHQLQCLASIETDKGLHHYALRFYHWSPVTYDATTIVSDVSIQHNVQPLDVELIFEEVFDTGFYSFSICPVTSLILVSSTIQMHILELISVLPIEEMEDNSHRDSVMIYTHQPEEHPLPRANRSGSMMNKSQSVILTHCIKRIVLSTRKICTVFAQSELKKVVFHFPYIAYSTRKEPEETRVFAINIHAKAEWNQVTHPPFATNLQNHPLFSYQFGLWQSLPQRPVCVSRQKFSTFSNTQSQSPKTLSFVFNHKTGEMITPTDPGPSMDGVSSSALSRKFIQITSSQQKRNVTNELDAFHSVAPTPGIVCDSVVFVACLATSRFSQGSLLSIRLFTLSSLLHQPPLSRHEPPLLLINTPSKSAFFDCFDGSLLSSITHTEPAIAISLSPLLLTVLTEKRRLFVHSLLIETPPSSNPDDSSKLSSCCPAVKFKQEGVRALLANEVGNTSFLSRLIPTNLTTIESPNNFPLHSTTSLYSSESPQFPSSFPLITSSPDVPPPLASPGIGLSTPRQGTPSLSTHGSSPSHITAFSLTPYHAGSFGTPSSFDRERRLSNSETVSEKASDKEMSGQSRLDDTTQSTKMHSHPNLTSSSPRLTQRQLSDRQKDIADKERSLLVSHPPFSSSLIYVSSSAIFHGTRLITTPISLLVLSKTMDSDHIAQQSSFQIQSPLQSQLGYTVLPSKGSRQLASSIPQKPVTATIPLVTASSSQDPDIITSIPLNFAPSARLKQSRVDNEPQAICVGWDIHRFAPESFASVITSLSNQSEVPTPTQLSSLDWDTINTTETTLAMMTAYTSICSFLPSSPTSTEVTIFGYGTSVSPQQRSDWTNRVNECCCHLAKQHLRMLRRLNQSIADGSVKDSSPKFSEQIRSLYTKACSFFIRGHGNPYEVCSLFRQEVTSCAGLQFAENVSAEDEEAVKEANKESCEQTLLQFILSEVFDGCHLSPLPIPSTKELKAFLSTAIKVFRNHSPETLSQFVLSPTLPKAVVLHDHFTSIDQILLRTLIDLRGTTFSSTLPEEEDNAQNRLYFSIFVLVVKQCTLPFKDVLGESLSQDEDKEDPIACLAELKKDALAELMLDFFNKNDGWSQVETVRGKTVFSELIKFVHTHRPFASVAILTPELTKGSLRFDLCLDILGFPPLSPSMESLSTMCGSSHSTPHNFIFLQSFVHTLLSSHISPSFEAFFSQVSILSATSPTISYFSQFRFSPQSHTQQQSSLHQPFLPPSFILHQAIDLFTETSHTPSFSQHPQPASHLHPQLADLLSSSPSDISRNQFSSSEHDHQMEILLSFNSLVNGLSGSYSYGNTSKRNASLFKLFFHPTVTQMTTSWTLGTVGNGPKFLSPFQIFSQCTDLDKSSRLPETIAEVKSSFDVLLVVALSLFERSILNPSEFQTSLEYPPFVQALLLNFSESPHYQWISLFFSPLALSLFSLGSLHPSTTNTKLFCCSIDSQAHLGDEIAFILSHHVPLLGKRSLSFPTFGEFVNSLYFLSSHTLFVSSQQSPSDSGLLPTCPQSTEPCMCKSRPSEMSPNDRMSFLTLLDCSEQPGLSTTLSFGLFVCLLLSCSLPYTAETIMPIIDGVFHRILSQQKETPLNHLVNSCICSLRTAFTLLLLLNQGDYSSLFKTCLETCVPHVYLALSNAVATTSSIWVLSLNTLFASTINLNVRDHISQQLLLAAIRKFPLSQLPFLGKLNEISSVPNNILSTLVFTDVVVDALRQAQQNEQGMRIKSILKTTTFPYQ